MVAPLSPTELSAALAELPAWSGDGSGISRTARAASFPAGIELVVEVARMAEDMNHHPDIDIRWRDVTFGLVTHSAGGVTALDIDLATRIDAAAG
jgi:4a-hydroxytetrahydrobiopterin dehydratase